MTIIRKWARLAVAVTCVGIVLAIGATVSPQSNPLLVTLTGQSMLRSDVRVTDTPPAAAAIASPC